MTCLTLKSTWHMKSVISNVLKNLLYKVAFFSQIVFFIFFIDEVVILFAWERNVYSKMKSFRKVEICSISPFLLVILGLLT